MFDGVGTPPRLDGRTINYNGLSTQYGDDPPSPFSYLHRTVPYAVSTNMEILCGISTKFGSKNNQIVCHQTRTNPQVHSYIAQNFDKSVHIRETVKGPR